MLINETIIPSIRHNLKVKGKGIIDYSLKDKDIIIKGLSEEDILEIKQIITDSMKNEARSKTLSDMQQETT